MRHISSKLALHHGFVQLRWESLSLKVLGLKESAYGSMKKAVKGNGRNLECKNKFELY